MEKPRPERRAKAGGRPSSLLRELMTLAWPVILARATQSVVGFSDALMVSPLGVTELAAVTTGAMNTIAFVLFPMGTVFIVQSFAAQLQGRGEPHALPRYAVYGLVVAAFAGVFAAAASAFMPRILGLFPYSPEVHAEMSRYMAIRLLSVSAVVGTEALGNWFAGLGDTRVSMLAGLCTMITNVALNYLLIEPRFGLPGYGVAGAAWASVASSGLGFLLVLALLLGPKRRPANLGPFGFRPPEFWRVLRFGLPNGFNWFLEFAAFALFINVVVGHLGTAPLAALNVVLQTNSIAFMPTFGLTSAGAILVGNAIGKRDFAEATRVVWVTAVVASVWMLSAGGVYLAIPSQLLGLFRSEGRDADFVATGVFMLRMSVLWQVFDALGLTFGEALRAAGDTAFCMWVRIVLAWLVFTPLAWSAVLVFGGGIATVMVALILYLAAIALALVWRFWGGRWKSIDLVGADPHP